MRKNKFGAFVNEFLKQVKEESAKNNQQTEAPDFTSNQTDQVENISQTNELNSLNTNINPDINPDKNKTILSYIGDNFADFGVFWKKLKNGKNAPLMSLFVIFIFIVLAVVLLAWPNPNTQNANINQENQTGKLTESDLTDNTITKNDAPDEVKNRPKNILEQQKLDEAPEDSLCGIEPGDTNFDAKVLPSDILWDNANNMTVPISRKYGGTKQHNDVNVCFQFSAQGAALAAMNHYAALQNPDLRKQAIADVVSNTGKDFEFQYDDLDSLVSEEISVNFIGYKILNTYDNATSVDIAFVANNGEDNVNMHMVLPVIWKDGDWKLVTRDGDLQSTITQLNTVKGYILLRNSN